ncbi:MAG TPA: glycosyltransferase [Vicinamibacterales bacterium]|nr:glycosyltransferase [Vicinamibacterales bacterium]
MNARSRMPSDHSTPIPVVRIITRLNIGGPSIQATRLTSGLEQHGFTTRLIHGKLAEGEGDMSYLLAPGSRAIHLDTLRRPLSPLNDVRALIRICRELKQARPAIIHTHMAKAGLIGRVAAVFYNLTRGGADRARVIHTYHGHVLEGYFSAVMTNIFITLERLLARATDRIVAISPAIEGQLRDDFHIGRATQYRVVPLGFDLSSFAAVDDAARVSARRELGVDESAEVISTVGRLTAIKQHRLFLDTIARVAATRPHALALIAGDGELRSDLEAYATELKIADRVRFLGWRRDLATIYAATDVFLLTSRNEGTPVALIEAMASGVPGVSTDVGGVKDVITSDAVGARVANGDPNTLAEPILRYLGDRELRRQSGLRARAAVLDRYGMDRLVKDIVSLYRELLAG